MAEYGKYADEFVRTFMIAAHQDLEAVRSTLAQHPDLLNVVYTWADDNFETPLGAAAHVGNAPIARFLLDMGAPPTIFSAASLGRVDEVARFLEADPAQANATGAHNIPLMIHVAMGSGAAASAAIAQLVLDNGGEVTPFLPAMLHIATARNNPDLAAWALNQGADRASTNRDGKTPLQVAQEQGFDDLVTLLDTFNSSPG